MPELALYENSGSKRWFTDHKENQHNQQCQNIPGCKEFLKHWKLFLLLLKACNKGKTLEEEKQKQSLLLGKTPSSCQKL